MEPKGIGVNFCKKAGKNLEKKLFPKDMIFKKWEKLLKVLS